MSESAPARTPVARVVGGPLLLLAVVLAGFATLGSWPLVDSLTVALTTAGFGAALRLAPPRWLHSAAPIPPLVGLTVLAVTATPTGITALYGGVASLALLLWLADDPDRLPGGAGRALGRLWVPTVGLAIAWASSFLLPGNVAPLGVGVALLVGVVVLAALLLRSPGAFDRDAAASS